VKQDKTVVVIGAGPYGMSVAAYLKAHDIPTLIFGKPMEFWQNMPSGLCLKSAWSASSLSDPAGMYTLNRYVAAANASRHEPIPLPFFLDYARWFQQHMVPDFDPTYVRSLARDGNGFHLDLVDGRTVKTSKVVVATGISLFAHIPDFARDLPPALASHTQAHADLTCFRGHNVVVVGSGQSGLEYAALLYEAGANVELIARGPIIWIKRTLYDRTGPAKHIFYPPSDVGPPGLNWLIAFPLIFSHLPDKTRYAVDKRAVRPAGAKWLRSRVEGHVRLTPHTQIVKATARGQVVQVELGDGTTREVDHLLLGTGFQANIDKLPFIDPALLQQVQQCNGYPIQNQWFESSIPGLSFVGALAGHTFGPICRFVAGAEVAARQITRHVMQAV
jgi:cation diffusion facilitator CzcD-associated flavoprotein CzcO